jgi:hypothetical protein
MKLGTQIQFSDGRIGTVVYNSLIGVGIKWGRHDPDPADFEGTTGNTVNEQMPKDWQWEAEALLREPFEDIERYGFTAAQCVGRDFRVLRMGLNDDGWEEVT